MASSSGGVAPESYIMGRRVSDADEFFDNTVDSNNISYILATITINGTTKTYTLHKSSSGSFDCFGAPADDRWLNKFRFDSLNPVSIVYNNGRYSLYIPDPYVVRDTADFDIKAIAVENNNNTTPNFDNLINSVTKKDCVEKVHVLGKFSWYDIPATTSGYISVRATGAAKLPYLYNGTALIASDYDPSNGPVIVVCIENTLTYNFDYFYCPVKDVLYIYEDYIKRAYTTPYISKVMLTGSLGNSDIMTDLIFTFINDVSNDTSEGDAFDLKDVPICAIVKTKNLVKVNYNDIVEQGEGGSSV